MKNAFRIISMVLIILMLTACGTKTAVIPEEYVVIDSNTGYYKIPDYNAGNVPEIRTGIGNDSFQDYAPGSDGIFVLQFINKDDPSSLTKNDNPDKIPSVKKFNNKGKLLWTKKYDMPYKGGGSGKLAPYRDGFIVTVEKYPYNNSGQIITQKSCIIRCDKDGNILWRRDVDDYSGRMFSYLFITDDQNIVTIGNWKAEGGKQVSYDASEDIVFTKFDENGEMVMQKSFGGNDFENLLSAAYSKDIGFAVNYYTRMDSLSVNMLACFDEEFNEILSGYKGGEKEYHSAGSMVISNGYIYQTGVKFIDEVGGEQENFIMKLDKTGKVVWRENVKSNQIIMAAALNDGNLVICGDEGDENYISIIDCDGVTLYKSSAKKDNSWITLYPAEDGGFVSISRRNIKNIPQPLYVSSIWFDTETVAAKYDNKLNLIWRKTYDGYHDVMTQDFVYPTIDGKLMVE